MTFSQKLK